jgi:hypothetical protein
MRYGVYYTPLPTDQLNRLGSAWLRRDAFGGSPALLPASLAATVPSTAISAPTRYGLHGTLKAPMRLRQDHSRDDLISALDAFAGRHRPITAGPLRVRTLGPFVALMPEAPLQAINDLAADAVRVFEHFRAPLNEAELTRRRSQHLSPRQVENLHNWGYAFVFDDYRFHITLTGNSQRADRDRIADAAKCYFADVTKSPFRLDGLGLFIERQTGAPFDIIHCARLSGPTIKTDQPACASEDRERT